MRSAADAYRPSITAPDGRIYLRIRDKMPGLTLWRFNHGRWDPVRSRREAILVTRGEAPGQIP